MIYECYVRHHLPLMEVNAENKEMAEMLLVKKLSKKFKESEFENIDIRILQKNRSFFKRFIEENF
jgi:hypothetical protein